MTSEDHEYQWSIRSRVNRSVDIGFRENGSVDLFSLVPPCFPLMDYISGSRL